MSYIVNDQKFGCTYHFAFDFTSVRAIPQLAVLRSDDELRLTER
jgi:hypothetical protein